MRDKQGENPQASEGPSRYQPPTSAAELWKEVQTDDPFIRTINEYVTLQLLKDFRLSVAEAEKKFAEFFSSTQADSPESWWHAQHEIDRLVFFIYEVALIGLAGSRIRQIFHALNSDQLTDPEYLAVLTADMRSSTESIGRVFAKRVGNGSLAATAASVCADTYKIALEQIAREISDAERKFGVEYIRPQEQGQ